MPYVPSLHQPRVSRETRRLIAAALIALVVLWLIGRIRFTDGTPPPAAVSPLLDQFVSPSRLADLAAEVTRVRGRVAPSFAVVTASGAAATTGERADRHHVAMAIAPAVAVMLLQPGGAALDTRRIATDPASGLTLVEPTTASAAVTLASWSPALPDEARYLFATVATSRGVSLRPVFVARLIPTTMPAWSGPVWATPPATELPPGAFVFTAGGEFAGLAVDGEAGPNLVPPETLRAEVDRLRANPAVGGGVVGAAVQNLSPALRQMTGAERGVIVTWVDSVGPAAGALDTGDVIEAVDGTPITTAAQWTVMAARAAAGQTLTLLRRRGGALQEQVIVAAPPPTAVPARTLGLTMQPLPGAGSRVTAVDGAAAAARAGIRAGDLITRVGDVAAPTPAAVRAAFQSAREGGPILVAITRGADHSVVVVQP